MTACFFVCFPVTIGNAAEKGFTSKDGSYKYLEEGLAKSAIMRQIKDAEEILDSGEADDKTGRHRLYSAFIKKAFPNARVYVDRKEDEIVYKLK